MWGYRGNKGVCRRMKGLWWRGNTGVILSENAGGDSGGLM